MDTISNKIGSVLQGRYRVLGFLGRGGMGAVYQCEDMRLPGKRWAVKEMLVFDPASQDQIEESFKREAQMLSQLRHRNLPMIVDYFIENSKQYLVMEYIEGENLAQLIQREGPATELQTMRWALELAQVLDYLHRQEKPVIFRDLKPDNTIITEDRHIKLVDFGLARQFDPNKRRDTQASGSVGYAPPEQWEDAAQTDERSDIYSLGATLFYILTGRPPSPVYGSQRLRPHRPNLDASAEAIVLKCLQPEPSQRYANSGELIRDLLLWLSKQPASSTSRPSPNSPSSALPESPPPEPSPATPVPLARPPRPSLTSPWVLRWLQMSTLIFLAAASLGLRQFWASQAPIRIVQDPLQRILQASAEDKTRARQLLEAKDITHAIEVLDKLITRYPEDAEAHIMLENAYSLLKNKPLYHIPVLTSVTGDDREGVQLYPGLAMAQKEINRSKEHNQDGGINGHLLYLDLYDCASRQDQSIELARKLSQDPNYQVVLGPWSSQQVIALAPIFEDHGIPALAPAASDPRVWGAGRHIFTTSESDLHRVEKISGYLWNNGYKRVAVLTAQESILSRSIHDEFVDAFTRLGGQTPVQEFYNHTDSEFSNAMEAIDRTPVDAVFLAEYRSEVVLRFARTLRRRHPNTLLAAQIVAFSSSIALEGGTDVDGLLTSTYFQPDANARTREFSGQFNRLFGTLRPSHREVYAYDSLMLLSQAIQEAGFEREKITEYLASVGEGKVPPFKGVSGEFSPRRSLELRTPYLVEIRDGQYHLLEQ